MAGKRLTLPESKEDRIAMVRDLDREKKLLGRGKNLPKEVVETIKRRGPMTIAELCDALNVKPHTLRASIRRNNDNLHGMGFRMGKSVSDTGIQICYLESHLDKKEDEG